MCVRARVEFRNERPQNRHSLSTKKLLRIALRYFPAKTPKAIFVAGRFGSCSCSHNRRDHHTLPQPPPPPPRPGSPHTLPEGGTGVVVRRLCPLSVDHLITRVFLNEINFTPIRFKIDLSCRVSLSVQTKRNKIQWANMVKCGADNQETINAVF